MAEKVGGVYYDIEARTQGLIEGQKQVKSSTDAIAKDLDKLGKSAASTGAAMATAGKDAAKMAAGVSTTVGAVTDAIAAYNKMNSELTRQRQGVADYIANLKRQNETIGMTTAELAQYEAARLGASEKDKQVIANLNAQMDAYNRNQAEIKQSESALAALQAEQEGNRKTVAGLIAGLEDYRRTLGMTSKELLVYRAVQAGATREDLKAIGQQFTMIEAKQRASEANRKLSATSQAVSRSFQIQKGATQQVSYQLQDMVVMAQMGSSWFTIIGQQAPQLLSVAGAGGAVLGVIIALAAAGGGLLYRAFSDSADSAEALEKAMEDLRKTAYQTDDGISVLSERLIKLAEVSERAALAEATAGIIKAEKAAKGAAAQIGEMFDAGRIQFAVDVLTSGISAMAGVPLEVVGVTRQIGEALGKTGKEAKQVGNEVIQLYGAIQKAPTTANFTALQDYISGIANESGRAKPEVLELVSGMADFFEQGRSAAETAEFLNSHLEKFGKVAGSAGESAKNALGDLKERMALATEELENGEEAAKRLALAFSLGLTNAEMLPPEILKTFNELVKVEGQLEKNKKAEQDLAAETKRLESDRVTKLDRAATAWGNLTESIQKQTATASGAASANAYALEQIRLTGQAAGKSAEEIQALVDAQNRLFAQQQQQQEQKQTDKDAENRAARIAALEQEIYLAGIKNQLGNEEFELKSAILALGEGATDAETTRITNLIAQMQQLRMEAELLGPSLEQSFNQTMLSSLDQFSRGMADIVLSGASAQEVFHSLASTIATELLTSIIRYYVGQAAAAVLGASTANAAGVAQGAALTAAYTPAAIAANIATLGGAATAAAATAPLAATATIAAISSGSLGAGRLNGGSVYPGMMHPVTEDGKPELLIQGGRQYLLPGSRGGEVVSNKDMMAMGGGGNNAPIINITNMGGGKAEVTEQRFSERDRRWVIDIVSGDIQQRDKIHGAILNTTTAGNRI